jgi:hypothetical protein
MVFESRPFSGDNVQAGSQDVRREMNPVVTSLRSAQIVTKVPDGYFGEAGRFESSSREEGSRVPERAGIGPLTYAIVNLATEITTFDYLVEGISSLTSTRKAFLRSASEVPQMSGH